jgi:hypothetical protein
MPVELSTLGIELAKAVAPYADAQAAVLTRRASAPTGSLIGERYLVSTDATGTWASHINAIAERTVTGWMFISALEGMSVWVEDEDVELFFDGTAWTLNEAELQPRAIQTPLNKRMPARVTTADGERACDIALAATPVAGSRVFIAINGVGVPELGDGVKANAACYFSADGGVTARALSEIVEGDVLYWQGSIAGYELAPTDVIEFMYEVA